MWSIALTAGLALAGVCAGWTDLHWIDERTKVRRVNPVSVFWFVSIFFLAVASAFVNHFEQGIRDAQVKKLDDAIGRVESLADTTQDTLAEQSNSLEEQSNTLVKQSETLEIQSSALTHVTGELSGNVGRLEFTRNRLETLAQVYSSVELVNGLMEERRVFLEGRGRMLLAETSLDLNLVSVEMLATQLNDMRVLATTLRSMLNEFDTDLASLKATAQGSVHWPASEQEAFEKQLMEHYLRPRDRERIAKSLPEFEGALDEADVEIDALSKEKEFDIARGAELAAKLNRVDLVMRVSGSNMNATLLNAHLFTRGQIVEGLVAPFVKNAQKSDLETDY